ncbi:major facilitator superfamily domain-containing protein 7-a [Ditylenchus destructor]|uniref:Major facilitator superfamily domain-containing protein 7-a n=1 Tax=Ditylenchus destructor TaxID=166010 RepID=A0AAD4QZ30_9BILA|nr:major facilitator superfamily domain-containing protein 7-a [Ditylenchus destructor]
MPQIPPEYRLRILYTGQTVAATSQPFFLCLSPKVAEYWFSDNQRALANALSFIANPFGVVVGSVAPAIFVTKNPTSVDSNEIFLLNSSLLVLATLVVLMSFGVRTSRPPTPPSASSDCEHVPEFFEGLAILLRTPMFYAQMITFGMALALQWSIFITADKVLSKLGYLDKKLIIDCDSNSARITNQSYRDYLKEILKRHEKSLEKTNVISALKKECHNALCAIMDKHEIDDNAVQTLGENYAKWLGSVTAYLLALSAMSGSVASILAGYFVDKTKMFKETIKSAYVGIAFIAIIVNIFLRRPKQSDLDTFVLVVLVIMLGFFAIPVFPISLELGVETTFPVAEATSSGILIIAGQLLLFLTTFVMQELESSSWIYGAEKAANAQNYQLSIDFWTLSAIFAAIFSCLFLWPRYHRLEYEENVTFFGKATPTIEVTIT